MIRCRRQPPSQFHPTFFAFAIRVRCVAVAGTGTGSSYEEFSTVGCSSGVICFNLLFYFYWFNGIFHFNILYIINTKLVSKEYLFVHHAVKIKMKKKLNLFKIFHNYTPSLALALLLHKSLDCVLCMYVRSLWYLTFSRIGLKALLWICYVFM